MAIDHYKLKDKSDTELHDWLCEQTPGTAEYNSGVLESMRRVATLEEAIENNENPVRKRVFIAACVAIITIVAAITSTIFLA